MESLRQSTADARGVVNFRGAGLYDGQEVSISFDEVSGGYTLIGSESTLVLSRAGLINDAQAGVLVATLTAHLSAGVTSNSPQPLLSVPGSSCSTGALTPLLATLSGGGSHMDIESKYVTASHTVFVDGQNWTDLHGAAVSMRGGVALCDQDADRSNDAVTPDPIRIELSQAPTAGMHLLQVQTRLGLLSNELPFFVQ